MSLSGTVQPHVCKPFLLHPMSASHFYCVPFFEIHFNFSHLRQSIRQNVSPCSMSVVFISTSTPSFEKYSIIA